MGRMTTFYQMNHQWKYFYPQTSNITCGCIRHTLVGLRVASIESGCCSNYIFMLALTPGFNELGKENCKTRRETFKFWDLMKLILEVWQSFWLAHTAFLVGYWLLYSKMFQMKYLPVNKSVPGCGITESTVTIGIAACHFWQLDVL